MLFKLFCASSLLAMGLISPIAEARMLATAPVAAGAYNVQPAAYGDSGPNIQNLQEALSAFVSRGILRALDSPNHPTAPELTALYDTLQGEMSTRQFAAATRQLVQYFQIQQGLGDGLGGVVEASTALAMNNILSSLSLSFLSGPEISCNVANVSQAPNSVTIFIFNMLGTVVATKVVALKPHQSAVFADTSNAGVWCGFLPRELNAIRAAAVFGAAGQPGSFAIAAE